MEQTFAPLMQLADRPLTELAGNLDMNAVLRQVIESLKDPNGVISAFGSFISDKD